MTRVENAEARPRTPVSSSPGPEPRVEPAAEQLAPVCPARDDGLDALVDADDPPELVSISIDITANNEPERLARSQADKAARLDPAHAYGVMRAETPIGPRFSIERLDPCEEPSYRQLTRELGDAADRGEQVAGPVYVVRRGGAGFIQTDRYQAYSGNVSAASMFRPAREGGAALDSPMTRAEEAAVYRSMYERASPPIAERYRAVLAVLDLDGVGLSPDRTRFDAKLAEQIAHFRAQPDGYQSLERVVELYGQEPKQAGQIAAALWLGSSTVSVPAPQLAGPSGLPSGPTSYEIDIGDLLFSGASARAVRFNERLAEIERPYAGSASDVDAGREQVFELLAEFPDLAAEIYQRQGFTGSAGFPPRTIEGAAPGSAAERSFVRSATAWQSDEALKGYLKMGGVIAAGLLLTAITDGLAGPEVAALAGVLFAGGTGGRDLANAEVALSKARDAREAKVASDETVHFHENEVDGAVAALVIGVVTAGLGAGATGQLSQAGARALLTQGAKATALGGVSGALTTAMNPNVWAAEDTGLLILKGGAIGGLGGAAGFAGGVAVSKSGVTLALSKLAAGREPLAVGSTVQMVIEGQPRAEQWKVASINAKKGVLTLVQGERSLQVRIDAAERIPIKWPARLLEAVRAKTSSAATRGRQIAARNKDVAAFIKKHGEPGARLVGELGEVGFLRARGDGKHMPDGLVRLLDQQPKEVTALARNHPDEFRALWNRLRGRKSLEAFALEHGVLPAARLASIEAATMVEPGKPSPLAKVIDRALVDPAQGKALAAALGRSREDGAAFLASARTAAKPAPIKGRPRARAAAPFQAEGERRALAFADSLARGPGKPSIEQGLELYRIANGDRRDPVTGFGNKDDLASTLHSAARHVAESGEPIVVVRGALRNLGGVNKQLGHSASDNVLKQSGEIVKQELERIPGARVDAFRDGPEYSFVVSGEELPAAQVDAALARARTRIETLAGENMVADIDHPKRVGIQNWRGIGMSTGYVRVQGGDTVTAIEAGLAKGVAEIQQALGQPSTPRSAAKPSIMPKTVPAPSGPEAAPSKRGAGVEGLLSEERLRHQQFAEKAKALGVPADKIESLYKVAAREQLDQVTGLGIASDRAPTLERAIGYARAHGERAHYVEIDIRNLGGVTAATGEPAANTDFKVAADLMKQELGTLGADVYMFRHGGDELSAVITGPGVKAPEIEAALDRARARFSAYAEARGIAHIAHPKHPNNPAQAGLGFTFQVEAAKPFEAAANVMERAGLRLEQKKLGAGAPAHEARLARLGLYGVAFADLAMRLDRSLQANLRRAEDAEDPPSGSGRRRSTGIQH